MSWWVHDLYNSGRVVELISWIFWVIGSITLHELAHGWAALSQGDGTPRELGRMTANPLVHMGPTSLLVFAVIGIAWGVMPVNPARFRWGRRGRILVSGAGPAMNIALAFTALTLLLIWLKVGPQGDPIYKNITIFLWTGGWLNVLLAVLNMLPFPPLDGASVLSGLSFRAYQFFNQPQAQTIGLIGLLVIFFTPIGGFLFSGAAAVCFVFVNGIGGILGNPDVIGVMYA